MKMIGTLPTFRSPRKPLVAFGFFVLVTYGAYQVAEAILADDLTTLTYTAMFFVGSAVVIAILNDWRRGLYILSSWILFEDFARKFFGNNMAIYFAKDVLALILYLSFFRSRPTKSDGLFRIPFRFSLLVFFWFAFLQVFNFASTSVFYGILGMKVYFLYVPLIFVGYAFLVNEEQLCRFFSFACILILIVAGLGIAQSIIGPTFF